MHAARLVVLVASVAAWRGGLPSDGEPLRQAATAASQLNGSSGGRGVNRDTGPYESQKRLFPPENLGALEGQDRDEWQQPDRVMDALGIADGAKVADLGAGGGWFTIRLAHRVGPNGVVFAEDIQRPMIESIKRRIQREGLTNVKTILGTPEDPMVPAGVQAVLIVDTYPQLPNPVALLRHVAASLAPSGRLGIVDFTKDPAGGPGPALDERVDPDVIVRDAGRAGLTLRSHETFLRYQYLLVFVK